METTIKAWKEAGIDYANFLFSCGGDSMNDYRFEYFDADHNSIDSFEHEQELEDEVFRRVDFYVNSDGHYMGEDGTVTVTLNEEGDNFEFSKDAQSEYCERLGSKVTISLTKEEVEYINKYVGDIIGGYDNHTDINYKLNFIKTEQLSDIEKSIFEKIEVATKDFCPEVDGELTDWYTFNLTENGSEEIEINGTELTVHIENEYYTYINDNF